MTFSFGFFVQSDEVTFHPLRDTGTPVTIAPGSIRGSRELKPVTVAKHFSIREDCVIAVLFILLTGAVITDLVRKKIYNLWILPGFFAGLILSLCSGGMRGLSGALTAALLALVILFPVYLAGGIGAGDVKLFAAAATWLSFGEVCMCILISFAIGAVYGLIKLLAARKKGTTIRFAIPVMISILFIFGGKL